jgi:C4-dicarboxylate-specific signal transduction histidine kinase
VIDVWITATLLRDHKGRPSALATTERDVTNRIRVREELEKRVEERTRELQVAHDELVRRERLATMGQLAGGVAHEIRNPLGIIRNATYFIRQLTDDHDEDVRDSFDEIQRALNSSNQIKSLANCWTMQSRRCRTVAR